MAQKARGALTSARPRQASETGAAARLAPGAEVDLGPLVPGPTGALRLSVAFPPQCDGREVTATLTPVDVADATTFFLPTGDVAERGDLLPGDYHIALSGGGLARAEAVATVVSGGTAEVTMQPRAAVACPLELEFADGRGPLRVAIEDDSGVTHFDRHSGVFGPFTDTVKLPIGSFTLRATTVDGAEFRRTFAVTALAADQPIIRLEVH